MKKPLCATLAVAVLFGAVAMSSSQVTSAAEQKPVVTVSFAGYDQLLSSVKTIGTLGGRPELDKMIDGMIVFGTGGKGLAGLDKARPWGVVLYAGEEDKYPVLGFVPVTDLKELMKAIPKPGGGNFKPDADGVYELDDGKGKTFFMSQKDTWAVVADSKDGLKSAPADPAALMGDLSKKYLVAVRGSVKNIPADQREKFIKQWQALAEMGAQMQGGDMNAIVANAQKQNFKKLTALGKELDEVVVGLGTDKANGIFLDVDVTALPDTAMAKQLAAAKDTKTDFAGLLVPGAALTVLSGGTMSDADVTETKTMLAGVRKTAGKEIDGNDDLNADQKKVAKELLGDALDVLEKTIETKKSDGGLAVMLDAGAPTLVAGLALADGGKLDKVVKQLVAEAGKDNQEIAKLIKLDAETYSGFKIHTASVPIEDESAATIFGKQVDIIVAIADNGAYVAAGKGALKSLKQVIDKSKAEAGKPIAALQVSLAGGPIAKFVAQVAPMDEVKGPAGMIAELLAKSDGKDHITLVSKVIPNGMSVRLNIEEGLIKAVMTLLPGGPGGPEGPGSGAKPKAGGDPF